MDFVSKELRRYLVVELFQILYVRFMSSFGSPLFFCEAIFWSIIQLEKSF